MAGYIRHLDYRLTLKQRLVFIVVNAIMALLLVRLLVRPLINAVPFMRELFSVTGAAFITFLITLVMLVVIASFVKPVNTFILIVILLVSFYIALEIFLFR